MMDKPQLYLYQTILRSTPSPFRSRSLSRYENGVGGFKCDMAVLLYIGCGVRHDHIGAIWSHGEKN